MGGLLGDCQNRAGDRGGGGGGGQTLTISDHRLPLTAILHLGIQRKGMNESESLEGDTLYSV